MQTQTELPEPQQGQAADQENTWAYTADELTEQYPQPTFEASITPVKWTASEFVSHDKTPSWFAGLGLATMIVAGLSYLIAQDLAVVFVILVAAVLFGVMAGRKPQTLEYYIDSKGIKLGPKAYSYASFKSFSVIADGALGFIQLMPVSRFAPPISVYYPPNQEQEIIETIGAYLPHEERNRDSVDRLMSKIRF